MKILIAALLSAALFMAVPDKPKNLNNSGTKEAPITQQAKQPVSNTEHLAKTVTQVETPVAQTPEPQTQPAAVTVQPEIASGSCADEIAKYNWSQSVALAVANAESGMNPAAVNDNPNTGDYSVGCFQVNIYGRNALTRPSESQLKDAATNVAWAHKIYSGNGNSFVGQWGVCRAKVNCY